MYRVLAQDQSVWRAFLPSKVGFIFIVTFLCASLLHSSAQSQDSTPPILTAFSFTPTTLDTSAGPAVVTASVAATDDLAGVRAVTVSFASPSGQQIAQSTTLFPPATSVSGTVAVTFPQFSEVGTWTVSIVRVIDAVGNLSDYRITELSQLGFPTALVVMGQGDVKQNPQSARRNNFPGEQIAR
jgi:hypothetical protein